VTTLGAVEVTAVPVDSFAALFAWVAVLSFACANTVASVVLFSGEDRALGAGDAMVIAVCCAVTVYLPVRKFETHGVASCAWALTGGRFARAWSRRRCPALPVRPTYVYPFSSVGAVVECLTVRVGVGEKGRVVVWLVAGITVAVGAVVIVTTGVAVIAIGGIAMSGVGVACSVDTVVADAVGAVVIVTTGVAVSAIGGIAMSGAGVAFSVDTVVADAGTMSCTLGTAAVPGTLGSTTAPVTLGRAAVCNAGGSGGGSAAEAVSGVSNVAHLRKVAKWLSWKKPNAGSIKAWRKSLIAAQTVSTADMDGMFTFVGIHTRVSEMRSADVAVIHTRWQR
jgi:hypothetical protein